TNVMTRFLLLFLFFGLMAANKLIAQPCGLSNLQISNVQTTNGKCYADVSFDMDRNNGNKLVYVHLWNQANYAKLNTSDFTKGAGPKYAAVFGSGNSHPPYATIAIDNFNGTVLAWSAYNYRHDPTV